MHSMLSMSTLSIHFIQSRVQFSHLITLYTVLCKATNTSVDSVDKHSIHCIACFDLHVNKPFNDIYVDTVDTNKIPYSIHYSIAFDLLY